MSNRSLRMQEKDIADQFIGNGIPWPMVIWGLGNTLLWFSLWPLVFLGILPLWLGFLIATLNITLCYLPSHDAQHYIIGRKGSKLEWLNELVGHIAIFPLTLPFRAARITHMDHHKYTNDPERDPDYTTRAPNALAAIWKTIYIRQPRVKGGFARYGQLLTESDNPIAKAALIDALGMKLVHFTTIAAFAWSGFAIEAVLLWLVPKHLALTYIAFYLSWAPHHPAQENGRYRNTRAFKSRLGNILSLGMQYHIVHHLYPTIPLYKTPAAYRALRPILEKQGCELGRL
jgi:beta-carotene hydroxylase